jgi:hypothetical protein
MSSVAEVEHDCGKTTCLEEKISCTHGLIELRPWLCCGLFVLLAGEEGVPAADPEEVVEADAAGCGGFGVQRVGCVNPGANAILTRSTGDEGESEASSSR